MQPAYNIYDILKVNRDSATGTISCQLGDAITGTVYANNAELWQTPGVISLPPNVPSNPTDAPQSISINRNDNDIIIATRYVAGQGIAGTQLNPGDTCIYANGADNQGQARVLLNGNNVITLYTAASPGAVAMVFSMDPSSDTVSMLNSKGYGIIINTDGITLVGKDGSFELTSGNSKLITKGQNQIDGSSILLGSVAVPGANSALIGPSGPVGVPSLKTLIQ